MFESFNWRPFVFPGISMLALALLSYCLRASDLKPKRLLTAQAETELTTIWNTLTPNPSDESHRGPAWDWKRKLTPWFPSEWPPTPGTVWTRYLYGHDVTLDGVVGVSAPLASISRQTEDRERTITPLARKLTEIGSIGVRPMPGPRFDPEEEMRRLQGVLKWTAAPRDPKEMVLCYRHWQKLDEPMSEHVAKLHPAFFAWLAAQAAE